jgi:MoaA/NifB/PqqE/SkfB family radical SAM enzyme
LEKLICALLHSRRIKDWFRAYFNYGLQNYAKGNPRLLPCKMGRHAFFLDPYGEVLACNGTPTPMSMGNLKTKSFEEIWNSAEAKEVREAARTCARNCWMMGSVAEPMKENLGAVIKWVVKRKIFGR